MGSKRFRAEVPYAMQTTNNGTGLSESDKRTWTVGVQYLYTDSLWREYLREPQELFLS